MVALGGGEGVGVSTGAGVALEGGTAQAMTRANTPSAPSTTCLNRGTPLSVKATSRRPQMASRRRRLGPTPAPALMRARCGVRRSPLQAKIDPRRPGATILAAGLPLAPGPEPPARPGRLLLDGRRGERRLDQRQPLLGHRAPLPL